MAQRLKGTPDNPVLAPELLLTLDVIEIAPDGSEAPAVFRGGPGSGHFGHEGRPGKVGGSQPSQARNAVPEDIRRRRFFHGENRQDVAELFIKQGRIEPTRPEQGRYFLAPVANMTYAAQDPAYALMYAVGGDLAGGTVPDDWIEEKGRYGYIFELDTGDFEAIQPDEDAIGQAIWKGEPQWLDRMARYVLTKNQYQKAKDGEYIWWANAGKKLVPLMSDEQKYDLIRLGVSVASSGEVGFKRVWRVDKTRIGELPRDPDFEDILGIAELVERGGPGSGHHGHKGRPGKVGGSLPSGEQSEATSQQGDSRAADALAALKRGEWTFGMVDALLPGAERMTTAEAMDWLTGTVGLDEATARELASRLVPVWAVTEWEQGQQQTTQFVSPARLTQLAADQFINELVPKEVASLEDYKGETLFGHPEGTIAKSVLDRLRAVDQELSAKDYETLVVLNPSDGSERTRKKGETDEVKIDEETAARMRGSIMIHNHPRGTAPSLEDFMISLENRVLESHVYHSGGRYIMRFNPDMDVHAREVLRSAAQIAYSESKPIVDRKFLAGELGDHEAWHELMSRSWERTAEYVPELFTYTVESK